MKYFYGTEFDEAEAASSNRIELGIESAGPMLVASIPTTAVDLDDNADSDGWSYTEGFRAGPKEIHKSESLLWFEGV